MPTTMMELENKLLDKLQALSEIVGKLSEDIARMTVKVENIGTTLQETRQHGERIRSLETEMANLKTALKAEEDARLSAERSAATERRWVIGTVIGVVAALVGFVLTVWKPHG